MSLIRRFALTALLPAVVALLPGSAAAATATTGTPRAAQDTTFKPDGSYTIDVAVGGQTMTFVVGQEITLSTPWE